MEDIRLLLEKLKQSSHWERRGLTELLRMQPVGRYTPVLEEWLRSGRDAGLRNVAMEIYRVLGCGAHTSLFSLLHDEDSDVRIFAASLLGDIRDREAVSGLIRALDDPDVNVRVAAAEALGKIGDERAVCPLTATLNGSPWEAMAAIEAIGRIGDEKALQVLHQCLEWEEYRLITCEAIGRAGNSESLAHLERCMLAGNPNGLVLKAMVEIVEKEGGRLSSEFLSRMVPFLVDLQESPDAGIRKAAFIALSWSKDMRGLPFFLGALDDGQLQEYAVSGLVSLGESGAKKIAEALGKLQQNRAILAKVVSMTGGASLLFPFAADDDPEVRTEVAVAMGPLGTAEAKAALLKLAADPADEVRTAARQALERFREGDRRP
jgi:HEAT repeat protein